MSASGYLDMGRQSPSGGDAGAAAGIGALGSVFSMLGNKGKFTMEKSYLSQPLADWTNNNIAKLGARQAEDEALYGNVLGAFNANQGRFNAANDADYALMDSVGPGGYQENRFGGLINTYGDDVKRSYRYGLMDQQRSDKADRARMGLMSGRGTRGNAIFADQVGRYNAGVDAELGKMRIDNANKFLGLGMGNIGRRQQLASSATDYAALPMQYRAQADALGFNRANNLMGLTKENTYFTKKDKKLNAFDYIGGAMSGAMSGVGALSGGGGGLLGMI